VPKLNGREDEPTGDGERRQGLKRDLDNLERWRHGESYLGLRSDHESMQAA
jgi:hypothetical protein